MYNSSSSPRVANCTFCGNTAEVNGGGMVNYQGSSPSVTHCTFSENAGGSRGGGMFNQLNSSPTVTNCTFSGNMLIAGVAIGGGMCNSSSSPTVTNCTFSGNIVIGQLVDTAGGGMYNGGSSPTVTDCTFSGNTVNSHGGAMSNFTSSNPSVTNCTFNGNTAAIHGGGMSNFTGSSPSLTNCTFSGNTASQEGGGMYNSKSSATVTNCILWGNVDDANGSSGGPFTDESAQITGGTPTITYTLIQGLDSYSGGAGNIDADPLFVDPDGADHISGTEDNDLRLLPCSPAIDSGSNDAVPDGIMTDLDGNPRFVDGDADGEAVVDMGAYEFQAESACCPADFNGDGSVGPIDLATLLGGWGPNPGHPADLDEDGVVGPVDLATLLGVWGPCS